MKNKLTIIVLTYNRSQLLIKALQSLENQVDQFFDVLIYNNASTDDTINVINNFLSRNHKWVAINGIINNSIMGSVHFYIKNITTPAVTYLCDDDMFDEFYTSKANEILNTTSNKLICFNVNNIDSNANIISKTHNIDYIFSKEEVIKYWRSNKFPNTAGLTGFIFPVNVLENANWDYPNSFFIDTRLAIVSALQNGLISVTDYLVLRLEWDGSLSQQNYYRITQRLKAHILFYNDLKIDNKLLAKKEYWLLHNPINFFRNYFRNFIQLKNISFNEIFSIYTIFQKSNILLKLYAIICIILLFLINLFKKTTTY
jgi:glycosyltransferase involved in cell wall biosynthesis